VIDPILDDPRALVLTAWDEAAAYARARGREPVELTISVASAFFHDGTPKDEGVVAYMPRRGAELTEACWRALRTRRRGLAYQPIDRAGEAAVAEELRRAGFFLATSVGEWFGLPALEAMAAGCIVVSVPVRGGAEYLHDGRNCLVAPPEGLAEALFRATDPSAGAWRDALRSRAIATAAEYRPGRLRARLRAALRGPLEAWA
jgi:glycosyltransferase involved in cell wall biosynthesis